jgi:hypothetical protein
VARSLQEKGMIRYRRGVVDVVDRPALQQLSCECYRVIRGNYERLLGESSAPEKGERPPRYAAGE